MNGNQPLIRLQRTTSPPAGVVTTLVTADELPALQSMAAELGIQISQLPAPAPELPTAGEEGEVADVEAARQGLEDLFNLF